MSKTAPAIAEQSLEDQIFERLAAYQEQNPEALNEWAEYRKLSEAERKEVGEPARPPQDRETEELVYQLLFRELRGVAAVLPGVGWKANHPGKDYSCRFTSVLNKAFLRIIEKHPDKLMQAQTRSQLTGYVSRTMSNIMLDHYRRKGTFRRVVAALGLTEAEDAVTRDIIGHLADEKRAYFEQRTGVSFQKGLETIEAWAEDDDPARRDRARVLRLRYVDGLGYEDIGREMGISASDAENIMDQAKYHLRKLKS